MTALRNYFNYRRLTKPATPRWDDSLPAPGNYHRNGLGAGPTNPEAALLRTARAERALYSDPEYRRYEVNAGRSAVSANNVGMECLEYDLPRAFRNFMDALAMEPEFALARNNLGLAYILIGDADRAIYHLTRAIADDETLDIAYANRGLARLELGQYEKAYDDLSRAIQMDPHDPMHHNNMGVLYLDAELPETALGCFEQAIRLDSSHPTPWRNLGYVYRELNEHDKAADSFDKASILEDSYA